MNTCGVRARTADADIPSSLAAAVWTSTVAYCAAVAGVAMAVSLAVSAASDFSLGALGWSPVFVGVAAVVGFVVGAVTGIPLALTVTFGHAWLGERVVAILIPLVALVMSALIVFAWLGTRSVGAIAVAAILTVLGGGFIAFRYWRLARARPVH